MDFLKDIVRSLLHITAFFLVGMLVYTATLWAFDSTRLYYDGLVAVLVMLVISHVAILGWTRRGEGGRSGRIALMNAAFAGAMLVYAFHITLPTIIDRSISLFVLSRLETRQQGVTVDELQASFLAGYVNERSAVCRRLDEQIVSGNVVFQDGRYFLAPNGERILSMLRTIASLVKRTQYYVTDSPLAPLTYTYVVENGLCRPKPAD